ncbi:MAG TPA: hypothetical protein VGB18_09270, partial [Candidatus Thermoplasmatota archaeon]
MQPMILAPLIVTLVAGGGFVVNEWSHGGLSESMGMGHHHMLDYDDPSCEKHGPTGHGSSQPMNATDMCGPM